MNTEFRFLMFLRKNCINFLIKIIRERLLQSPLFDLLNSKLLLKLFWQQISRHLLDQLTDVRNFGAIIRTAVCTGVDAIIVPKSGGAPVTDDTVKTSAGAIFNIPICKVDHIKDALFYLQGSGVQVVAATEKTESSVYDLDYTTPTALVMGSEGKGVTAGVLKLVDQKAKLPMTGTISSLNVSVACGAFLYEIVRQRS